MHAWLRRGLLTRDKTVRDSHSVHARTHGSTQLTRAGGVYHEKLATLKLSLHIIALGQDKTMRDSHGVHARTQGSTQH